MLSRGVCTVALTLSGVAWLLFLCGLAAVQAYCSEDNLDVESRAAGYLGPASCSTLFGYSWWIVRGICSAMRRATPMRCIN